MRIYSNFTNTDLGIISLFFLQKINKTCTFLLISAALKAQQGCSVRSSWLQHLCCHHCFIHKRFGNIVNPLAHGSHAVTAKHNRPWRMLTAHIRWQYLVNMLCKRGWLVCAHLLAAITTAWQGLSWTATPERKKKKKQRDCTERRWSSGWAGGFHPSACC